HAASAARWATGGAELVAFSLDQPCSASFSVEAFERAREVWRNDDLAPERAVEGVPRGRTLEAGASAAGIGAATLALRFERQLPVTRDEAEELVLRCLPPAAHARPDCGFPPRQRAGRPSPRRRPASAAPPPARATERRPAPARADPGSAPGRASATVPAPGPRSAPAQPRPPLRPRPARRPRLPLRSPTRPW